MDFIKYKDALNGITGFLNGQQGLHDQEQKIHDYLVSSGLKTLILDNLFEDGSKLFRIKECENIVLSTTGTYADKLSPLIAAFEKLNFAPRCVIFMGENTALAFCGIARELKKKHGTKFYFPDIIGKSLIEISWI